MPQDLAQKSASFIEVSKVWPHVRLKVLLYPSISTTGEIFWNGELKLESVCLFNVVNVESADIALNRLQTMSATLITALRRFVEVPGPGYLDGLVKL